MANPAQISTGTIRGGGFRIEISAGELIVTRDKAAVALRKPSITRSVLKAIFPVVATLLILIEVGNWWRRGGPLAFFLLALLFGLPLLLNYFRPKNDIRCTPENLEVIRVRRGKTIGKWTFPRNLVSTIRFTVLSQSRTDQTCGLVFLVQGNKVKVLEGLEIVEAYRILQELERLGYEAPGDVSMPMAVEMATERRNSIFG
jgi:hypothetical protein